MAAVRVGSLPISSSWVLWPEKARARPKSSTFTRPSGQGSYQVDPGETPLDDTFRDTRVALSGGYSMPLGRVTSWDVGLYGSTEHDYTSLAAVRGSASQAKAQDPTAFERANYLVELQSWESPRR